MVKTDWLAALKTSPVAHRNPHLLQDASKDASKKTSKYNNQKREIDGHLFHSKREARRYLELRIMLTANIIQDLLLQVPYELNEGGSHSLRYIADFVYQKDGEVVVEDVKGAVTATFKKKQRLMKEIHGIDIKITK